MNIKEFRLKDIEGKEVEVKDLSKNLGNLIYNFSKDVALADIGRDIYNEKEVKLSNEQKEKLIELISSEYFQVLPVLQRQLIDFIKE